jgi:hypothetical protein
MWPRLLASFLLSAASFAVASSAIAQSRGRADAAQAAQASALFEEGRRALTAKDESRACAAFRESLALDVKVGTLLNVAKCEERHGELAQADAHLHQAIDRAREQNDRRVPYLETQLAALDARVPQLTVKLAAGAPSTSTVRRDGIPLADVALGLAVPVDVGHHVIEVSAGDAVKRYEVDMALAERLTVEVAPPATLPTPPPPPSVTATSPSPRPPAPPAAESATTTARSWSSRKTTAVVLAAAGGVGLVIGAVFGARALSDRTDAHAVQGCNASGVCTSGPALHDWGVAHDSWSHDSLASTLGLALGGAAVAAGVVVWITAPAPDAALATSATPAWNLALTPSRLEVTVRF